MKTSGHIRVVTRSPKKAQTVQQLKFDTILVYVTNGFNLVFGIGNNIGETSNALQGLVDVLPYKNFYGGGGTNSGGGITT